MVEEHTFTTLSHPQETMTGLLMLGLKRTQETLRSMLATALRTNELDRTIPNDRPP
jgi:hypothetical protein